ncbi:MAG: 2-C-methyl-D-erythritol 4-phosphate cytidylyltransferase [Xanthomonadales bacterium]|nr:2-C-methyl-D-erythritol 4-phosphate cytidylyltransferase [Xanthomonadales bacterium]
MTWVVVPAAGCGSRAGLALPKQYADLAGRPMLAWTLESLLEHPRIAGALVVLAAEDPHWPGWTRVAGKPVHTAVGGEERCDSVLAGLQALPAEVDADDWVLVHDAARPCLSHAEIDALLAVRDHPVGALLAVPVADTLKRADAQGDACATIDRADAWRALTPQMFRREPLRRALAEAVVAGARPTDEAAAMERLGCFPRLVPGRASNLKVTTGEDLALAAWWLGRQQR